MNAYYLPTSLTIGEVEQPINYGWQNIIDILSVFNNQEISKPVQVALMLRKLYINWAEIPMEHTQEAIEKACQFLDCGKTPDDHTRPRVMDWEQDAEIIIPAINQVAGREIRLDPNIHWWTFFGWYMSIGDGLFASVLRIRSKKAKGKKLEKWEEEFYQDNKKLIDFRTADTEEVRREKDSILKWL
jgi:hypothetical protein